MQRNNFNFKNQNVYVGIDVHKQNWQVSISMAGGYEENYRMSSGNINELVTHLRSKYPGGSYYSVYESGFSGYSTHRALEKQGIKNIIVNAADVPTMQKEKVNKTDAVDSNKLSKALMKGMLTPLYVPTEDEESLREMYRHREDCVKKLGREKSQIKHFLHRNGIPIPKELERPSVNWSNPFVIWLENVETTPLKRRTLDLMIEEYKWLRQRLLSVTLELRKIMKTEHGSELALLTSVPGVGMITAMAIVSEVGNFSRFNNERAFASYIGLSPTCHNSGEKETTGEITFRCNRRLRKAFIESSWIAIRRDNALSACFLKHRARMNSCDAIVRIARKLSCRVLSVMKTGAFYVTGTN